MEQPVDILHYLRENVPDGVLPPEHAWAVLINSVKGDIGYIQGYRDLGNVHGHCIAHKAEDIIRHSKPGGKVVLVSSSTMKPISLPVEDTRVIAKKLCAAKISIVDRIFMDDFGWWLSIAEESEKTEAKKRGNSTH